MTAHHAMILLDDATPKQDGIFGKDTPRTTLLEELFFPQS